MQRATSACSFCLYISSPPPPPNNLPTITLQCPCNVPAISLTYQVLLLNFLSLPVFQDPAPWNVVWRAGGGCRVCRGCAEGMQ